jgi:hypothetical protein
MPTASTSMRRSPKNLSEKYPKRARFIYCSDVDENTKIPAHIVNIQNMAVDVDGDRVINVEVMPMQTAIY